VKKLTLFEPVISNTV